MILLPEEALEQRMQEEVEPYLQGLCKKGKLNGELYYECFLLPEPKGTVVISHGFTEAAVKFHEFIYYLLQQGWNAAILDHRGHGNSLRKVQSPYVVHIGDFGQYVRDLHDFVHTVVMPGAGSLPLCLFGHSMGGGIAARYLETYPEDFDKAILNAPMMGIQTGSTPSWLAALTCGLMILLGKGKEKLFFHTDFQQDAVFETDCATSKARFDFYHGLRRKDPALQTSAASYSWTREAILAGKKACKEAGKIQVPVLLLQAEDDTLVSSEAQETFIRGVKQGRMERIPGSKHEIYRSGNAVLENYWEMIFAFLGD